MARPSSNSLRRRREGGGEEGEAGPEPTAANEVDLTSFVLRVFPAGGGREKVGCIGAQDAQVSSSSSLLLLLLRQATLPGKKDIGWDGRRRRRKDQKVSGAAMRGKEGVQGMGFAVRLGKSCCNFIGLKQSARLH